MLKTANNVYIIWYLYWYRYFVYEYCNGGSLEEHLKRRGHLQETEALNIFQEIVKGLKPVIDLNIIHRYIIFS